MLKKLFANKYILSFLAPAMGTLSFGPIDWWPLAIFYSIFLVWLVCECKTFWEGLKWGFLASIFVMLCAFYWVVYTIHVFGFLPWVIAAIVYVGFCGIGALNIPIFVAIAAMLQQKFLSPTRKSLPTVLWFTLGIPALYTIIEYFIPKLFPWYIGHAFYRIPIVIQISEITSSIFLSFALFSVGSTLVGYFICRGKLAFSRWAFLVPITIWALILGFGAIRLWEARPQQKMIKVALVQANIGSLEKLEASMGAITKVNFIIGKYLSLTEQALKHFPGIQLVIWPETALPFTLDAPHQFADVIRKSVERWKVPLITGAYARSADLSDRVHNAAVLLDPKPKLRLDIYPKNVLLAFGEYMPFGETFPFLYDWFPAVSNFDRGRYQRVFTLSETGTRIGMTICYEAIIADFVRSVGRFGMNIHVNLTNDSWFGPTSEPYQHAQLSVFRAVELRVPMVRVTNTGISFVVDDRGRIGETTKVNTDGVLVQDVVMPWQPPRTFYLRFGNWFVYLCMAILGALGVLYSSRSTICVKKRRL